MEHVIIHGEALRDQYSWNYVRTALVYLVKDSVVVPLWTSINHPEHHACVGHVEDVKLMTSLWMDPGKYPHQSVLRLQSEGFSRYPSTHKMSFDGGEHYTSRLTDLCHMITSDYSGIRVINRDGLMTIRCTNVGGIV